MEKKLTFSCARWISGLMKVATIKLLVVFDLINTSNTFFHSNKATEMVKKLLKDILTGVKIS